MTTIERKSWPSRVAAAAGAFALGVVGLAGGALGARADSVIPVTGVGNIKPDDGKSSLTIHKYDGKERDDESNTGAKLDDTSDLGDALTGVEFTVKQVIQKNGTAINLTTAAGWDAIDGITADKVINNTGATYTTVPIANGNEGKVTTDSSGEAVAANLPYGLYLVTETGYGDHNIKNPVAPFLVTLPLPQKNGNWLYDVHTYPKNEVDTTTPEKTVGDSTDNKTVPWTINAPVRYVAGETVTSFEITDALDPRLTYVDGSVVVKKGDTAFVLGDDYTVQLSGGVLTVAFTSPTGVGKLAGGEKITVTFSTAVTEGDLGEGTIENTATVYTNDPNHTTDHKTNTPTTNWGRLEVLKYALNESDANDTSKTLAGAEFTVYSDADGNNVVGTITTDADGKGSIKLFVGSNTVVSKDYWFKETQAPAGYVLDGTLRKVTVTPGEVTTANNPVQPISNTQQKHPNLPLTGAAGMGLMSVAGIALIGAGVAVYMTTRKRSMNR
jgi:fimbrial isopeptide formation D2 family protein/LPXTG-motif cell wall-anchored protein